MAESRTPAIVIDDLHASYGTLKAIDGISLQIQRGEYFDLLGQNGAGKTTLLSCLEGIKKFDEGTILIDGLDVAKAPTKIKELLGVQLQDAALFMDLTAKYNQATNAGYNLLDRHGQSRRSCLIVLREIFQFYSALYNVFLTRQEALALLEGLGLAEKANAPPRDVIIRRPNLEDVFLSLTDRTREHHQPGNLPCTLFLDRSDDFLTVASLGYSTRSQLYTFLHGRQFITGSDVRGQRGRSTLV